MTQTLSSSSSAPTRAFGRMTGLLYLLAMTGIGLVYGYSQMLPGPEAAILAVRFGRGLFGLTLLAGAAGLTCYLLAALAFFRLFQGVSRGAAAALALFVIASVPLSLAALAQMLDIISLVDTAAGLAPRQAIETLRAPVGDALASYNSLMLMSALFWGLWLIPLGWLVYRSRVAPRAFGICLMAGSLFYLTMFTGAILDPAFSASPAGRIVGAVTFIPAMVGELGACAWLLIFGGLPAGKRAQPRNPGMETAAAMA